MERKTESSTCNGLSLHTLKSEMPFSQWVIYDFRWSPDAIICNERDRRRKKKRQTNTNDVFRVDHLNANEIFVPMDSIATDRRLHSLWKPKVFYFIHEQSVSVGRNKLV